MDKRQENKIRAIQSKLGSRVAPKLEQEEFDADQFLEENRQAIYEAIVFDATKGRAGGQAKEVARKLVESLEKKKEVRIEFTAADYIRAGTELLRRQREDFKNGGVCPICGKLSSVSIPTPVDKEREHDAGSEVATVAISS